MKKYLLFAICMFQAVSLCFGWDKLGHEIVIAIAQRHLTPKAKENIAAYMPYDLKKDAVWMDKHRKDKDIAYTTSWHTYDVDSDHYYDPNPRLYKGDIVLALRNAAYTLSDYKQLSDSAVVMNIRQLIHFMGDIHCPVHMYFPGINGKYKCRLNGREWSSFHGLYDHFPNILYPDMKADEIAAMLDTYGKKEIEKITSGDYTSLAKHRDYFPVLYKWVKDISDTSYPIWEINKPFEENLNPDTVSLSEEIVNTELRNAGYRLARLLNELFDN